MALPTWTPTRALVRRVALYGVGGVLSIGIRYLLFRFAAFGLDLGEPVGLAISNVLVGLFNSLWNIFVNFRGNHTWAATLPKYVTVVGSSELLGWLVYQPIASMIPHELLRHTFLASIWVGMAVAKYFVYHYWVYPHSKATTILRGEAGENAGEEPLNRL